MKPNFRLLQEMNLEDDDENCWGDYPCPNCGELNVFVGCFCPKCGTEGIFELIH